MTVQNTPNKTVGWIPAKYSRIFPTGLESSKIVRAHMLRSQETSKLVGQVLVVDLNYRAYISLIMLKIITILF